MVQNLLSIQHIAYKLTQALGCKHHSLLFRVAGSYSGPGLLKTSTGESHLFLLRYDVSSMRNPCIEDLFAFLLITDLDRDRYTRGCRGVHRVSHFFETYRNDQLFLSWEESFT